MSTHKIHSDLGFSSNLKNHNLNYEPKELYDFEEIQKIKKDKMIRKGKDITFSVLDYITIEEEKEYIKQGINPKKLLHLYPIPENITLHSIFIIDKFLELRLRFPDDTYLLSLEKEENLHILFSYDWYLKYGLESEYF